MHLTRSLIAAAALFASTMTHAQNTTIGSWRVNKSTPNLQIANTTSGATGVTGIACFLDTEKCSAYLGIDMDCVSGEPYPMMINSPVGAFPIITSCTPIGNHKYFVIEEFDAARRAFESGGEIGFAMPMKNGQFRVIRFDTRGATPAIKEAMTRPATAPTRPVKSRTDEIL